MFPPMAARRALILRGSTTALFSSRRHVWSDWDQRNGDIFVIVRSLVNYFRAVFWIFIMLKHNIWCLYLEFLTISCKVRWQNSDVIGSNLANNNYTVQTPTHHNSPAGKLQSGFNVPWLEGVSWLSPSPLPSIWPQLIFISFENMIFQSSKVQFEWARTRSSRSFWRDQGPRTTSSDMVIVQISTPTGRAER